MTATCALHFDATAAGTCERCGRFACETCLGDGAFCTECAPQAMDPYGMNRRLDHLEAVRIALRLVGADWRTLLSLVLLFSGPLVLVQDWLANRAYWYSFSRSLQIKYAYDFVIGLIGAQAMLAVLVARAEGRSLGVRRALAEGVGNWSRALGASVRALAWVSLFGVIFVVPGLWQLVKVLFVGVAAMRTRDRDAVEASRQLVNGRFWRVASLALIVVGVTVVGGVAGVLVRWLAWRVGLHGLPNRVLSDLVARTATDVVGTAILLVSFVMLHVDAGVPLEPMRWREPPPRQS